MFKGQVFLTRKKERQKQTLYNVETAYTYYLWYLRRTSNHSNDKLAIDNQGDCELWGDACCFVIILLLKLMILHSLSKSVTGKKLSHLGDREFGGRYGRNKDSSL